MIKGTLSNGFEFHIDENTFDDFEIVELFAKVNKNPIFLGDLMERWLGAEQKTALLESLRGEDGKIHTSHVFNALTEIENIIPTVKN
jgi:hypothetical protein